MRLSGSNEHQEETVGSGRIAMPEPIIFTSNKGSRRNSPAWGAEDDYDGDFPLDTGSDTDSVSRLSDRVLDAKNELRYRLLLYHSFHESRMSFSALTRPIAT